MAIDLNDLDDPESYSDGIDFRASASMKGRPYCIPEACRGGPAEIAAEIQKAMKIWDATKAEEP